MDDEFRAGGATRSIMPSPAMVDNTLHYAMTVRFDEPGSPLCAKALALSHGPTQCLLIALDSCGMGRAHAAALRCAAAAATGLSRAAIIVSASHSHSAPHFEPLERPHPYFELVQRAVGEVAAEAWAARQPARIGHGLADAVGASFNTRVPLPDGRVKFTRDWREGLASGRPVDPRLNVVRVDDLSGTPLAGWVRFAAHPACVIFDAPASGEYPGYLTERLSESAAGGAPVLFGYGASGDVNCVPMFGTEADACRLGVSLADLAAPVFEAIETRPPARMGMGSRAIVLPLDAPPSLATLDEEIAELGAFMAALDETPDLTWVIGINCGEGWPVAKKRGHVKPLLDWALWMRDEVQAGRNFPAAWPSELAALVVDDLGLVFHSGEPFTELGLSLAARSPLHETLLMGHGNGSEGYVGAAEDRRRGGYETYTNHRYRQPGPEARPLPYHETAGEALVAEALELIAACTPGPAGPHPQT